MKKLYTIFLIMVLIFIMTACENKHIINNRSSVDSSGDSLPDSFIMFDTEKWPENEYTANIPQPESESNVRGWIDPDKGYCYIELPDMTKTESEKYIETLKATGFAEVEKVAEEIKNEDYVSIGTLLTYDGITVSIAYLDEHFGMCIKKSGTD